MKMVGIYKILKTWNSLCRDCLSVNFESAQVSPFTVNMYTYFKLYYSLFP